MFDLLIKSFIYVSDCSSGFMRINNKWTLWGRSKTLLYDARYTPRNEVVGGYTGFTMSVRL